MKHTIKERGVYCWVIIVFVMFCIHCYQIGQIPCGINVDEMGMGYDAWCLSNYGTDRYLNSFPVYLINFSGGQSALYAYLCAPFVYFLGISATVLRIPAVIFSFVTLFFSVRIADYIWGSKKVNLLVGLLYTVSPVFLMLSRVGLDCNLMLGMSTCFLYLLIRAVDTKRYRDFLNAGIAGGVLLYSYVLSHIVMPLFIVMVISYLFYVKKIDFKKTIVMGIPLFLLAFPLILFHYINILGLDELNLGIITIPKLYRYRSDDLAFNSVAKNAIEFFKYTFLYDNVPFNSVPEYGNMYFVAVPFIIVGMGHSIYECVYACKKRVLNVYVVVSLWGLCVYLTCIFLSDMDSIVYRGNSVFFVYLLFETKGVLVIYDKLKKYLRFWADIFVGTVVAVYVGFFFSFLLFYFEDYKGGKQTVDLFNYLFVDALDYIEDELPENVCNRTTYIGEGDQIYIYYLGGKMMSPYEYNVLADDKPYTLWLWTQSHKNYRFYFPEIIDPSGNYIVPDTADSQIDLYEQYGFKKEHIGRNYLFWNDLLGETQSGVEAVVEWGHGIVEENIVTDEGENSFLSGWSLNTSYGTTWDDIVAVVDEKDYYVAEKFDREDVSNILKNEDLIQCGFRITVPSEVIRNREVMRIVFIDYKHRKCYVEIY